MPKTLSSQQAKPALSPWSKGGIGLGLGALALVVIGLVFPTGGAFFPLVSLWCSCVLFYGALWVLRVAHVELNFFHRAVLVGLWAAAVLYFYWALGRRQFIYAWDYVNYIVKQYSAETAFAQGPAAGFAYIFGSFADDYTNFITLFTEFPFCLTARTGDSYAFAQVFCVLPTLMVLLAGLTVKIGQMLHVKNRFYHFLIGFSWVLTFPFLRMSAMLAQPDWFGLIFAFAILLLTLDYRFEKLEPGRFALIFLATAAIILTRRWYLYFVVGYYFSYALLLFVSSGKLAKAGDKALALSLVLFTRVQNSGSHQMLLYLPAYVILFLVGAAGLAESIDKFKVPKLCYWAFTLVFAVSVRCSPLTVMALPELVIHTIHPASLTEYMHFDELTYDRKDLSQIQAVTEWLTAHLGEGDTAYMIPDDMLYNPGHLRNCMLPEHPLDGKLPDSFSVPGTHTFPMGFFEAKYVITADPFPSTLAPDTELGHRFNAKFIQLRDETHTLAATFDMGNGYTFSIWERVEAPTREEVETYLHVFDAENAQYPEMFSQVTEGWLAAHGL